MNGSYPPPARTDLRAQLEDAPYIDDAGFTERVAHGLPARRRAKRLAYTLVPATATVACALAFLISGKSLGAPNGHVGTVALTALVTAALALLLLISMLVPADE